MSKLLKRVLNPFHLIDTNTNGLTNYSIFRISTRELIRLKPLSYFRNLNEKKGKSNIKSTTYRNEKREVDNVLQDSINKLPTKHRVVFLMKTIHNYKTEDICEELGITRNTFWKIIHEARLKLMNIIEEKNHVKLKKLKK